MELKIVNKSAQAAKTDQVSKTQSWKKVPGVRFSFKKDETVFSKSGKNEKVFSSQKNLIVVFFTHCAKTMNQNKSGLASIKWVTSSFNPLTHSSLSLTLYLSLSHKHFFAEA